MNFNKLYLIVACTIQLITHAMDTKREYIAARGNDALRINSLIVWANHGSVDHEQALINLKRSFITNQPVKDLKSIKLLLGAQLIDPQGNPTTSVAHLYNVLDKNMKCD